MSTYLSFSVVTQEAEVGSGTFGRAKCSGKAVYSLYNEIYFTAILLMGILIHSAAIAQNFRNYFETVWRVAKK